MLALATLLLFPVPETVAQKLPSVLVDVAPANDGGAWVLARDERYGDLELWRLSGAGSAERAGLPEPDGRRPQAIATSASGDEIWVLTHRAVLSLLTPAKVESAEGTPPALPGPPPTWQATPLWLEGGDLKRGAIVPLARGRAAWVAELAGVDGGARLVGEIVEAGASVATFSLPSCGFKNGASSDGAGGLVLGGIGRITPSPNGWLGSFTSCGDPSGSAIQWQRAPLETPSRVIAANGAAVWHWQGDVLKNGESDAFTIPKRADGAPVRALGSAPSSGGGVWVGVHGYVARNTVTMMSLGAGGVESSMALPFPRWWKTFLRTEALTVHEGAGHLWVLQTYPGKASVLLRRDAAWGKWRAFYGANVKPRVDLLERPAPNSQPGEIQQVYDQGFSCLAPVRTCFAPGY